MVMAMPEDTSIDLQTLLARIEKLEAKLAAAEAEIVRKDQIIAALMQRLYGSKSERLDPAQINLDFDDATLGKPEPSPENGDGECEPEAEGGAGKPKRNRRRKADLFPRNLPVVIEAIDIPEEVAADPDAFTEIGEEHHDELDITRAAVFWRRRTRKKFVSKTDRSRPPLMPPAPRPSIPGTHCAPDLMAQIIVDKHTDHLPHYRQERRFLRRHGVELSRKTINTWSHAAAAWLMPIGWAIKRELLESEVVQVDETPMSYLNPGHGKTSRGYLWTYLDPQSGTVCYDWQLGRGHDCLLDFLGHDPSTGTILYQGLLQCDGYSAYQALVARFEGIRLGACLAHIRRKFHEALEQASEVVMPILDDIQKLYRIEHWLRNDIPTADCRWLVRQMNSKPLVESLKQKIDAERATHLPHSKLGEAVNYALGQWQEFACYLEDGRIEIDNNLVENAIRPAKLGLKNYLFFGSAEAGVHNALLYTLVANCRVNDLDPEIYLAEAIRRMTVDPTEEQAAALTPSKLAAELRVASIIDAKIVA
jgi:transposase